MNKKGAIISGTDSFDVAILNAQERAKFGKSIILFGKWGNFYTNSKWKRSDKATL